MNSKVLPESESITPLDCIFACSVCGATFSDIYQQKDTVHGLSDGINPKERNVTRLYVTSCCHVICIKHIEGGNGPAFYQAGQQPQATCPVCVKESSDDTARQLFSVRGFSADEHDPAIPKCWFTAPPMKLEGKDKEMEGLRFQYLALIRFSKNITTFHKQALNSRIEAETKLRSIQDLAAEEHEKVKSLQEELERLRPLEGEMRRLHRLEAKLPATRHYLNFIPKLVEQNNQMQQRLASLGFAMSFEPMPNFNESFCLDENDKYIEAMESDAPMDSRKTGSSHTVGRSAHNTYQDGEVEKEVSTSAQQQRPLKRSRIDSPARASNIHAAPSSRDMMPPPSKPLSKLKSVRKMIPSLRNRFSNGRSPKVPVHQLASDADVQMYDNGRWEVIDTSLQPNNIDERPPTRHCLQSETAYMSGALPVDDEHSQNAQVHSRLLSGLGIHSNESDFTFEAPSAMKIPSQRLGNLPTEPSYIRLLDGLGHHSGLDLGLEDPRCRDQEEHHVTHQPKQHMRQLQRRTEPDRRDPARIQTRDHQKQWNFGHAFLQQSPVYADPISAYNHSQLDHARYDDAMMNNSQDQVLMNPITPAPIRSQRPADEVDHVVSPFFRSRNPRSQPFSRFQFAEPDISSSRSDTYQSHHHEPSTDTDWREPRSLNGLSFFDSPVNRRNERIEWRQERRPWEYRAPQSQRRVHHINAQGLLTRPDTGLLPGPHDGIYSSIDRSSSRGIQNHSHSAIPFPALSRPPQSRATRLPSAMPSIIPGRSPPRLRSQAENMGMIGVRSSQHARTHMSGQKFASPVRSTHVRTGRRVVRR